MKIYSLPDKNGNETKVNIVYDFIVILYFYKLSSKISVYGIHI